jgi:hypothetical protein
VVEPTMDRASVIRLVGALLAQQKTSGPSAGVK